MDSRLVGALRLTVAAIILLSAIPSPAAQRRITSRIDDSAAVTLTGNVHPKTRISTDQGRVRPDLPMQRLMLTFRMTPSQQSQLNALLAAQQDPTSPKYHRWLTPDEFGAQFGPAQSDIDQVNRWLQAHGFAVVENPPSRQYVAFSGTAAQVEAAFRTEIHHYLLNGEQHYANATEPQIPAALAGVVMGVRSLHNFRPRPRAILRPHFTSASSGNNFLAPGDFATIYDINPLYTAGINGTGQTIAIMGQTDINLNDIGAFRAAAGLPAAAPTVTLIPGSADPGTLTGDLDEANLDIEWSGAVATNATILYINSTNVFDSMSYAINNNVAPVISISYGDCEANWTTSDINTLLQLGQLANAQGITIVAASGDQAAADCDYATGSSAVMSATHGPAVDVPASLPYVTGVGGTTFNEGGNTSQYWKPKSTTDIVNSALAYIPETSWNDTAYEITLPPSQSNGLTGSGGGVSTLFTKPSWQTGPGVPADGHRDVPDVSFAADYLHDGYLICTQSLCASGFRLSDGNLYAVGGTSAGAPTFAGVVALINQKTGHRQGNVNPLLYQLAQYLPAAIHDITTGNNIVPCTAGSTGCPGSGSFGYSAGTGYDQVTGIGSLDVNQVVNGWPSGAPTLTSLSPATAVAGGAAFTLTVNGTNFMSGATVQWNGSARSTTFVNPTQVTASITANDIYAPGSASVTVVNPGQNGGASAALSFTITGNNPVPTLTSVSPGTAVAGAAGFTMTVTGRGFVQSSVVNWNGTALQTTFVSSSQLSAAVTSTNIASSGTAAISVTSPTPGGGTSATANFYVLASAAAGGVPLPQARYLPHIVSGSGYVTKLTVLNLSNTNPNPVIVQFISQSGTVLQSLSFPIPAGGAVRYQTPESGRWATPAPAPQWAIVYSQDTVGVNAFFEVEDTQLTQNIINAIGFNDSPAMTNFTIPIEMDPTLVNNLVITTGIAIANTTATQANVTMNLVDQYGTVIATATAQVPPFGQFADDIMDTSKATFASFRAALPAGNFIGSVTFSSNVAISAVTVEDDHGPFSATPPMPYRVK